MRKIISTLLGFLILAIGYWGYQSLLANKKVPEVEEKELINSVFVDTVLNKDISVIISASGSLQSSKRLALFSEVSGIFESSSHNFKPGTFFPKHATLLSINSEEYQANIQAQKSILYNQLVLILPDLKLDFPDAYPKWLDYVNSFDFEKSIPPIPGTDSQQEKMFIASKNIFTNYFKVKNLQERLKKYKIKAPWPGLLTSALVTPGTLITPGQKLGEFIDPKSFEVEVNIPSIHADYLIKGALVQLQNIEKTRSWSGKIIRINNTVDPASQTVQAFIKVSGENLREGMYLEAKLQTGMENNCFEIARNLLFDEDKLFTIQNGELNFQKIQTIYFKEHTAVVKGLKDGTLILSKPIANAHQGMRVKVLTN